MILCDLGSSEYIIVAGESRVKELLELGYPQDYKIPALLGDFGDRNALHEGTISLDHAAELHVLLDSPKKQRRFLAEVIERGLSVKAARTRARELSGEGENWIIRPGEVWVSKEAKVAVYPSGKGYKVDFSFTTPEDFERIVTVLRNRLNGDAAAQLFCKLISWNW